MKLKKLKNFKPERVAKIEANMWKAYYRHNFLKLFICLLQLSHEQFHISYFYALRISYPSAYAAMHFRKNRGKENRDLIVENLTKFYKSINNIVEEKFDFRKAALLETEWWFVDRYSNDKVQRREVLANSMASIYNVNSMDLTIYAEYRALAMELQDEAEKEGMEADWDKAESLLLVSYKSLYEVVNKI